MSETNEPSVPDDEYLACTVKGNCRADIIRAVHAECANYVMEESALEWVVERLDVRHHPTHHDTMVAPSDQTRFEADALVRIQLRSS